MYYPSFQCEYPGDVFNKRLMIGTKWGEMLEGVYHLLQNHYLIRQSHLAQHVHYHLVGPYQCWGDQAVRNIMTKLDERVIKYVTRGYAFQEYLPVPPVLHWKWPPCEWKKTKEAEVQALEYRNKDRYPVVSECENHYERSSTRKNCLHYLAAASPESDQTLRNVKRLATPFPQMLMCVADHEGEIFKTYMDGELLENCPDKYTWPQHIPAAIAARKFNLRTLLLMLQLNPSTRDWKCSTKIRTKNFDTGDREHHFEEETIKGILKSYMKENVTGMTLEENYTMVVRLNKIYAILDA